LLLRSWVLRRLFRLMGKRASHQQQETQSGEREY
jgi:hypothetical protein